MFRFVLFCLLGMGSMGFALGCGGTAVKADAPKAATADGADGEKACDG